MNYFEFHIGDYAEATMHLSFVEDAAYSRLLRKYYALEGPLPADLKQVQRLIGARTREEKSATEVVLQEFFLLTDDGWRNSRCDLEIEKYRDGEPEREVKKANEANRLKKHRIERAALFKRLTDAGHHAPWNIGIAELRELVASKCAEPATPDTPLPATAPATPATATQTPVPNTHPPVVKNQNPEVALVDNPPHANETPPEPNATPEEAAQPDQATNAVATTRKGELCRKLRALGIEAAPHLQAWAEILRGFTDDEILAVAESARERKPGERLHLNYLLPMLRDSAAPKASKPKEPPWWSSESSMLAKGKELGLAPWGGESWQQFRGRIDAKLAERAAA